MDIPVSRVQKSLLNARVNVLFYVAALALSYFSRRVFLQALGAQFVGFTGTAGNFLGFLNLAEMGTAMAISYALYRPLLAGDKEQIATIVSLTGYLYRRIGLIITAAGVLLSLFLPLIFPHPGFPMAVVYFAWYAFLISSLLSYFLNYGQVLLDADQRNYVVTAWLQTTTIVKILLQVILLAHFHAGYITWIAIELAAGILQSVLLRRKIRQSYPYLHSSVKAGKAAIGQYPGITRSIKQLSIHKLSDFALVSTKEFFIYLFTSLTIVAYYGNYVIILTRVNQLLLSVLTSMQAGIGHLIAENNTLKTMAVFWEILALRYFTTGIFLFAAYQLIEPFISLWLGREYLLDKRILFLMLCNGFLFQTKDISINFIQGYGLFDDLWAPVAETVLNLVLTLLLGYFYGIPGVLMGSIISMFLIAFVWKPIYLFRRGFKQPPGLYWQELAKYLGALFLSWYIGHRLIHLSFYPDPYKSYSNWLLYALAIVLLYSVLLFVLFYPLKGMRQLVKRFAKKIVPRP
jgi:O-antigen/teichoic acid export membrane protein